MNIIINAVHMLCNLAYRVMTTVVTPIRVTIAVASLSYYRTSNASHARRQWLVFVISRFPTVYLTKRCLSKEKILSSVSHVLSLHS